jgi:hypothetical protein
MARVCGAEMKPIRFTHFVGTVEEHESRVSVAELVSNLGVIDATVC